MNWLAVFAETDALRAQPKHTVPTGFAALPPPGPATPVMESESVPLLWRSAPSAISRAASSLTAPWVLMVSSFTPRSSCFAAFE